MVAVNRSSLNKALAQWSVENRRSTLRLLRRLRKGDCAADSRAGDRESSADLGVRPPSVVA